MASNEVSNGLIPRRTVLAAGLAPLIVPRHGLGGPGYQPPSDTLTIAAVGLGGMGRIYLDGCQTERIVAVCDLGSPLLRCCRSHSVRFWWGHRLLWWNFFFYSRQAPGANRFVQRVGDHPRGPRHLRHTPALPQQALHVFQHLAVQHRS